mgnify:CR=1 FL=1
MNFTWVCYQEHEVDEVDLNKFDELKTVRYNESYNEDKGCFGSGPGKLGLPYIKPLVYIPIAKMAVGTTFVVTLVAYSPFGQRKANITQTVDIIEAPPPFEIRYSFK